MEFQGPLSELGRRLRAERLRAGLGVTELARLAGVSRRHVTEAEAGRANLSVGKLFDLAGALGVRAAQLVDFDPRSVRDGRIALVGLRGAGKSSVGQKLALALEVPFVELDRRVEELAGLSLAAIFELHGVEGFRRLEAEALEQVLAEGQRVVLATGGSIVGSPATFARLRRTCHTVWLKARPEEHYRRVLGQGDRRPMRGRPRAMEELEALLAERERAYASCELTLDTSERTIDEAVACLRERYGQ
jgi:XRE family transcriptional regulator, aerobic/anaerobic benzoate catabolism transcriptional regulator